MKEVRVVSLVENRTIRITTRSGAVYSVGKPDVEQRRRIIKSDGIAFKDALLCKAITTEEAARIAKEEHDGVWIGTTSLPGGLVLVPTETLEVGDYLGIIEKTTKGLVGSASTQIKKIEIVE